EIEALRAENATLLAERSEAQERQAAIAEILRVIAASPAGPQPALDAVVTRAKSLSDSVTAVLNVREGEFRRVVAVASDDPEILRMPAVIVAPLSLRAPGTQALRERRTVHIPDRSDPAFRAAYPDAPGAGIPQATLSVPLLHEGEAIGFLTLIRGVA